MDKKTTRPCGNPECSTSTGIHEGLTFGSGLLLEHGFWEFPCRICAKHFDDTVEETKDRIRKDYPNESPEKIEKYIRESEWLNTPAWPEAGFDFEQYAKDIEVEKEELLKEEKRWEELQEIFADEGIWDTDYECS